MPTIIDSLVIELGLDTRKFDEGQKRSIEQLRKFEVDASKHVKGTQKGVDDLVTSFTALQGRLLAIGGLIAAGLGFNRLTQDVTKLNSETGFLAQSLGDSAKELANWENVGKTVGAQANEISQSFALIKRTMADLQLGKGSFLSEFSRTTHMQGQGPAVELFDAQGRQRSSSDILVDISRWYAAQKNKAVASRLMEQIGFGQGMINLLGLGPEELKKRLKAMEELGPSADQIKRFQELTKAFGELTALVDRLATIIVDKFSPGLTKVLNMISDWLGKVIKSEQTPPEAAGTGMSMLGMPELAPNAKKPSLFQRGWNWLFGKPSDAAAAGAAAGGGGAAGPGTAPGGAAPSAPGAVAPGAGGGTGAFDRSRFEEEIRQNPELADRLQTIVQGEVGHRAPLERQQIQLETIFNRAAARGQTLDQVTQMYTGPGSRGYYPAATFSGGAIQSQEQRDRFRRNVLNPGLAGSDRSTELLGFPATGNASGGVAARGISSGRYTRYGALPGHAETYVQEGNWGGGRENIGRLESTRRNQGSFPSWLPGAQINVPGQQFWGARGGLGSASDALLRGGDTSTSNTNTSSTHIGEMNVTVPPGADPTGYANGIRQELQRYDNVQQSNTGLQ